MTLSLPSALAAATRAVMPPPPLAEVWVAQLVELEEVVLPHAEATSAMAPTKRPRRRIRCQFIRYSPLTVGLHPIGCRGSQSHSQRKSCAVKGAVARNARGEGRSICVRPRLKPPPSSTAAKSQAARQVGCRFAGQVHHLRPVALAQAVGGA